ncbi:MAG: DUF3368 domain-containing protein [Chloroflexi bacterium]|nr:DUF3368 domain-containing protein [Chloroflexota bacterium]
MHLLERLFGTVIAPPMVQRETARTMDFPTWLIVRTPQTSVEPRLVDARLDAGEHQVIHLAMETSARRVILDDLKARRTARSLGLPIIGTAGVLLAAKTAGHLPAVRPYLDALLNVGFFISPSVYRQLLESAGEA